MPDEDVVAGDQELAGQAAKVAETAVSLLESLVSMICNRYRLPDDCAASASLAYNAVSRSYCDSRAGMFANSVRRSSWRSVAAKVCTVAQVERGG